MRRLEELLDQLADTNDIDQSVAAVSLLEAEASPEWLPRLYEVLATPGDFYIREGVAPAIIGLEGVAALPQLIAALRLGFAEGHDCDTLQAYVSDLVESEPSAASSILLPLTESSDPADRSDAAWLLGFVHTVVPPDVFLRLATDESARVRRSASGSLASLEGHEAAFHMLVQRLNDPEEDVRIEAMSSLGYFGDSRALPILQSLRERVSEGEKRLLDHSIALLAKS